MTIGLAVNPNGRALVIAEMSDEELALYRQAIIEQKRIEMDELNGRQREVEAELTVRMEKNGGRALCAKVPNGPSVTFELKDEWTPWAYDVKGLREKAAPLLPSDEAAKVVKHVEEQVTVVAAHDEAGNPRSITALISKYGPDSPQGKALSECMTRAKVGVKLTVTVSE